MELATSRATPRRLPTLADPLPSRPVSDQPCSLTSARPSPPTPKLLSTSNLVFPRRRRSRSLLFHLHSYRRILLSLRQDPTSTQPTPSQRPDLSSFVSLSILDAPFAARSSSSFASAGRSSRTVPLRETNEARQDVPRSDFARPATDRPLAAELALVPAWPINARPTTAVRARRTVLCPAAASSAAATAPGLVVCRQLPIAAAAPLAIDAPAAAGSAALDAGCPTPLALSQDP